MAKISQTLSTKIALDTLGATESLKNLQAAIRGTASAWKAQEHSLKASGDALGAAKAKYSGLGDQIQLLDRKLASLKSKQSALDGATEKNSREYLKLQKDINSTVAAKARLEAQQEKARKSMDYYSSGLAKLQSDYKDSSKATASYITRLEAEGKQSEIVKVKHKALTDSVDNLTKQLSIQERELEKVESTSGKASRAYKIQQTRVNETATSLAKAKKELGGVSTALSAQSSRWNKVSAGASKLGGKLSSLNDKAKHTGGTFGKFLGANLISSAVTNGLSFVQSKLSGIITTGVATNKAVQNIGISFQNAAGGSQKMVQQMTELFGDLRAKSGYAADTMTLLTKKTTAWTEGNATKANKLGTAFVTLGRALGMNDGKLSALITKFGTLNASGSVTSASLTKMERQLPGFSAAMEKSMGKSREQLNTMASKGKLSMQDLQKAMITMADSKKNGLDNYYKTWDGFTTHFQMRYASLSSKLTAGLFSNQSNFLLKFSKMLDGKEIEDAFTKMGNSITKALNVVFDAFGKGFKTKGNKNPLAGVISSMSDGVVKFANTIAKNKDQITQLVKGLKSFAEIAFRVGATMTKTLVPVLNNVAMAAAKHPKAFGSMVIGYESVTKAIIPMTVGMLNGVTRIKQMADMMKGLKERLSGSKLASGFKAAASGIGKAAKAVGSFSAKIAKTAWSGAINGAKKLGSAFASGAKSIGRFSVNLAKVAWSKTVSGAKSVGSALASASKATGRFIVTLAKAAWGAILSGIRGVASAFRAVNAAIAANPIGAAITAAVLLGAAMYTLYKKCKPFRNFVNGLARWVAKSFGKVISWASHLYKNVAKAFSNLYEHSSPQVKALLRVVGGSFKSMYTRVANTVKAMWKFVKDLFKDGFKIIGAWVKTFADLLSGRWGNLGKDIKKIVSSMWSGVKHLFSNAYKVLNAYTGGFLGKMVKWFKDKFTAIVNTVGNLVHSMRMKMIDLANAALTPINWLLEQIKKGINWVLSKFGASEIKASWKLSIPKYAKGTPGAHKGGFALVNDAKGSKYREMYKLPNGEVGLFPKQRNLMVNLPKGTEVLDGENTHALLKAAGIPAYKDGIWSKISGFTSGLFKKGVDLVENVGKILAHPIKFMESVFKKYVGGGKLSKVTGFVSQIVSAVPSTIAKWAMSWIKSLAKKSEDDAGGSVANPKGASVTRWRPYIKRALAANGLPTSAAYVSAWLRQIQTESGGNPKAVQPGADPDHDGSGPALGLVQTKRSTFLANAFSGHKSIFNGYDNLLAGIRYAKRTYGGRMLSVIGSGHGYANGGLVTKHQIAQIAEGNKPEMIIPLDEGKRGRAWDLLGQTYAHFTKGESKKSTQTDYTDIFKALLAEMKEMNTRLQKVEQAQYATALTPNDIYKANKDVAYQKQRIRNTAFQ